MVKTYIRVEYNGEFSRVMIFVACDGEALVANELYTGLQNDCIEYANHYEEKGMMVERVEYGGMEYYNQD